MSRPKRAAFFVDFSLLGQSPHFRAVFVARMMSVFALGILTVAVPVQIYQLTGSTLHVGMAMALDGIGMFVGLMVGGVLADRYDRRRLILLARGLCGVGFLALAANSFIATPSVMALYIVSAWDGFFGAVGITALMAAIPGIVGRENLPSAGALTMLITRFGAVVAPAVGGLIVAGGDVSWNYLLAGVGTLGTLVPLVRLPTMRPEGSEQAHPLRALAEGCAFLWQNKVVGGVVAVGTLQALLSAIRVLFPALAEQGYGGGAFEVGLMYAAVPLGAMIGAFTSGWVGSLQRPGLMLLASVVMSSLAVASLGAIPHIAGGLIALAIIGYFGSIASLLQFTLVQGHTPDHLLGRVNSLWSTQDVVGDVLGTLGVGALARAVAPMMSVFALGASAALAGVLMALGFGTLRRLGSMAPPSDEPPMQDMAGEAAGSSAGD